MLSPDNLLDTTMTALKVLIICMIIRHELGSGQKNSRLDMYAESTVFAPYFRKIMLLVLTLYCMASVGFFIFEVRFVAMGTTWRHFKLNVDTVRLMLDFSHGTVYSTVNLHLQNRLTIPKLALSTVAIMGQYGRHFTKSYTVALKCSFLITIPLLLL